MSETRHLSDLQLDQIRLSKENDKGDTTQLAHLETCAECKKRLEDLEDLGGEVRPQLAAMMLKAEGLVSQKKSSSSFWRTMPALAALGAVIGVLLGYFWLAPGATTPEHKIQIKGGPSLLLVDSQTQQLLEHRLKIGQKIVVRLSGPRPPVALVMSDDKGSLNQLWPLPGEALPHPGETLELPLSISGPESTIQIIALYGPTPLSPEQARELSLKFLKAEPAVGKGDAPKDIQGIVRTYAIQEP